MTRIAFKDYYGNIIIHNVTYKEYEKISKGILIDGIRKSAKIKDN